jgi:hypothetical protein
MKAAFCLVLLCSVAHAVNCPSNQKKDEAALLQIEENWVRIVEQDHSQGLECILAAEFEEAGATGELITRSQMLAPSASSKDTHVELSDMHAHVYGDFAYVRGVGLVKSGEKPTRKTRFTDIFAYREGRWQCVAGHESRFP